MFFLLQPFQGQLTRFFETSRFAHGLFLFQATPSTVLSSLLFWLSWLPRQLRLFPPRVLLLLIYPAKDGNSPLSGVLDSEGLSLFHIPLLFSRIPSSPADDGPRGGSLLFLRVPIHASALLRDFLFIIHHPQEFLVHPSPGAHLQGQLFFGSSQLCPFSI